MPPIDLIARVQDIRAKLERDFYRNEYQFQLDLFQTVGRGYDGHLYFWPDLLTGYIAFEKDRRLAIVSVSEDGIEVPKIYLYDEVVANTPRSAVSRINGLEATSYLDDLHKAYCQFADRDACYNILLFAHAGLVFESYGDFQGLGLGEVVDKGYIYPGSNTSLLFENGTSLVLDNYAVVTKSLESVADGKSPDVKSSRRSFKTSLPKSPYGAAASKIVTTPTAIPGYPKPVLTSSDGAIHGYYLASPSASDTAVLVVRSFVPTSQKEFQKVAEDFISKARNDGKTKIILDFTSNTGGFTFSAIDLYGQFFPKTPVQDFHRVRRTAAFDILAKIGSNEAIVPDLNNISNSDAIDRYRQPFNYRYDLNKDRRNFNNLGSMLYGPRYQGDNYTSIKRLDYKAPYLSDNGTIWSEGIEITGYDSRTNFTQPFPASSILLLTDGTCSSACFTIAKSLISQGVKSIVFGGRPHLNKTQSLGGARSLRAWSFEEIRSAALKFSEFATEEEKKLLDLYQELPLQRSTFAGVNIGDLMFEEDVKAGTGVSGQMRRVDADCRLFYTASMVRDIREIWEAAAARRWGGGKCAVGGFEHD
ncbi:hypothetical protein FKW77_003045 [Venturia effusa]|uniref:Uncharacterized protein n=1 Tax=Venturia effusa TaxID=50376 RepID=A0A517LR23_9PEZI|nr:hypothetical protein FKW77_003045 [Venturia effusa]